MSEWPKGSLQWAIDNAPKPRGRIRRKSDSDYHVLVTYDLYSEGRLCWSYGPQFVPSVENALALDWEVCE